MIKEYLIEVFEPSLFFGLLCSLVGFGAAIYYHYTNIYLGIIAIIGIITLQIAVNLIDDYVDYKIGLDKETEKTKFSGGSELVSSGKITTNSILLIAIIALLISGIIGLYILQFLSTVIFWIIVVLILFGGISVIFYASYFTHLPYMSELFVTVSFALVGLGIFLVMTNNLSNLYSIFLFACIPSGLQVGVAMIANEMPDKKADKKYGRKSMVIMLSDAKKASILYFLFQSIGYVLLCIGIIEKVLPMTFLVVFALIPFMYIIGKGIKNYKTPKSHEKIMGLNSIISFLYLFLILIAFVA